MQPYELISKAVETANKAKALLGRRKELLALRAALYQEREALFSVLGDTKAELDLAEVARQAVRVNEIAQEMYNTNQQLAEVESALSVVLCDEMARLLQGLPKPSAKLRIAGLTVRLWDDGTVRVVGDGLDAAGGEAPQA